jgi:hypothetical protein
MNKVINLISTSSAKVAKMIVDRRNKTREQRIKTKFLGLYLTSVGKSFYSDPRNLGEPLRNKDKHKFLWNKAVKKKTDYEILQRSA